MTPQGLQLLYLPPFSIIARFFVTAVFFAFIGSTYLTYQAVKGELLLPPAVHLFTLGFMAMTMIGALFQMLPVVAGVTLERPLELAFAVHVSSLGGVLLLVLGFITGGKASALTGLLLLLASFGGTAAYMLYKLLKAENLRDAPRGFIFALTAFLLGLLTGSSALLTLAGFLKLDYARLFDAHVGFMLWGWTALLVASVSFQVIEMFFVTPPYPRYLTRYLPPAVLALTVLRALIPFVLWDLLLSALFVAYAAVTAHRLSLRRRRVPDPLVYLWYYAVFFLAVSALLYPFKERLFAWFLLSFGLFVLSVISSMMMRIVAFLVWMHLTSQGVPNAPTMFKVIEPSDAWTLFSVHTALIASLVLLVEGFPLFTALFLSAETFLLCCFVLKGVLTYARLRRA
ncbi:MAG: hypothetical protein GXO03_06565 [Aquificae bacterium]|nr:hypothetical protein [Aquificota bacterium]